MGVSKTLSETRQAVGGQLRRDAGWVMVQQGFDVGDAGKTNVTGEQTVVLTPTQRSCCDFEGNSEKERRPVQLGALARSTANC